MGRKLTPCPDPDELRRMVSDGYYMMDIMRHYGRAYKTILKWLAKYGIPRPAKRPVKGRQRKGRGSVYTSQGRVWQSLNTPAKVAAANNQSTLERFWPKVAKAGVDECWEWTAALSKHRGYGIFFYGGFNMFAHRASWMIHRGVIPADLHVLHRCHNRRCVNPKHLYVGDNKRNHEDVAERGNRKGELNHQSKLTEQAVRAIRASDLPNVELGQRYGVHATVIGRVRHGQSWTHVS